ncbi:MAG: hypothetical protein PVI88_00455 [Nitrosopumilaceae archaeon]|jgi:hypothetical protein
MVYELRKKIIKSKAKKETLEESLAKKRKLFLKLKEDIKTIDKGIIIVKRVAVQTQQEFQIKISEIVSLGLKMIFDDPYKFRIEFQEKSRGMDTKILLERDEKIYSDILGSVGLGVADVLSFMIRISLWKIKVPGTRNTIILDENFKHLRGQKEQQRILTLLKKISKKLKIQFIIVLPESFIPDENDNKIFYVYKKKGKAVYKIQGDN